MKAKQTGKPEILTYLSTWKNKVSQNRALILNGLGLILAYTAWLLIAIFVLNEWSFDQYHKNSDRICRVESRLFWGDGRIQQQATTPIPLAPALTGNIPDILKAARISRPYTRAILTTEQGLKFSDSRGIWADNSLFEIFTFPFIKGDVSTALSRPLSMVMTASLAEMCFPDQDPLDQIIKINNKFNYRVTGVIEDIPSNSHFSFSFIVSSDFSGTITGGWEASTVFTYALLADSTSAKKLNDQVQNILRTKGGVENKEIYLKPISRIHLSGNVYFEFSRNHDRKTTYIYLGLALLGLLAAWLNLFITRSYMIKPQMVSAEEKKDRGRQIITARSVFLDNLLLSTVSVVLAAMATWLLLPVFSRFVGQELSIRSLSSGLVLFFLTALLVLMGAAKGSFDSFAFPASLMIGLRKASRVFQFVLLLGLLVLLVNAISRFHQLKRDGQGIEPESILIMDFSHIDREDQGKSHALKEELLKNPSVLDAAFSLRIPFEVHGTSLISLEGLSESEQIMANVNLVSPNFAETFGLELTEASRDFIQNQSVPDRTWACYLNESAADRISARLPAAGSADFLGKKIRFGPGNQPILAGIIKDFPYSYRTDDIEPLVLVFQRGANFVYPRLSLRLYSGDMINTLDFIRNKYAMVFPGDAFDYRFFSQDFQALSHPQKIFLSIIGFFSGLIFLFIIIGVYILTTPSPALIGTSEKDLELKQKGFILEGIKWVLFYLFVLLFVRPSLFYFGFGKMSDMPLFSIERALVVKSCLYPGGLIELVSGYLAQFFYYPLIGALIITALAWSLSWLTGRILLYVGGITSHVLKYLPALLLLMSYTTYDNPLRLGLALVMGLIFFLGYLRFPKNHPILRVLGFGILFIITFVVSGGAGLIFALLAVIYEMFSHRNIVLSGILVVISLLLPFLMGLFFYNLLPNDLYLTHLPFHPVHVWRSSALILQGMCLIFPLLLIAAIFWKKMFKPRKAARQKTNVMRFLGLKSIFSFFLLLLLFIISVSFSFDTNKKILHELIYSSHKQEWGRVLAWSRKLPADTYNLYTNYQINRALYHLGRLSDEMFSYFQQMDAFNLIPAETERFIMRDAAIIEISLGLGSVNIAEHLSLELFEVVGGSPLFLSDLADILIAKNRPETARVFLSALANDPVFKKSVKQRLLSLDKDPEQRENRSVGYLRSVMLEEDTANINVESLLLGLLERNPYNRMAFEYLMAVYLMERRLDKVVENLGWLNTLGYKHTPRHIEEAVLLHTLDVGDAIDLKGRRISTESLNKFQEFSDLISSMGPDVQPTSSAEMRHKFGRTYFYYYAFDRSGVQR